MFVVAKIVQIGKAKMLLSITSLLALLAISCGKHELEGVNLQGEVVFYNESSYNVSVHESAFSGPILVEKLAPGNSFSTMLSPSDNYGIGTVFSIVYWYLVASGAELACGDVWTSGIDPNRQIVRNIIGGESYIIQIPPPSKLELQGSFIKILNTSNMPFEFNYLGSYFRQAGNGELDVPSGKVGVYKVNDNTEIKGYTITVLFEPPYPFPDLIAQNGYVYNYEFDGNTVTKKEEQKLTF